MKVEINNKSYKVRPFIDLTIRDYIKFFNMIKEQTYVDVFISYLSVMSEIEPESLKSFNVDNTSIRRIFSYMGKIVSPQDMPVLKTFHLRSINRTLKQKEINWRTLGVRKFLEEKKDVGQIEQAVYLLAIYISNNYDSERIEEIYQELQDYNAADVLGFVIFFFKKLSNGQKSATSILRLLWRNVIMSTPKLSKR